MIRQIVRKSYRTIMVVWLAGCLSLSANVALAAHQLTEEGNSTLNFKATEGAGNATASAELGVSQEQDRIRLTVKPQVEGLENVEDHEMWLVDEDENRKESVGRLDEARAGGLQTSVDNFEDFDYVIIARQSSEGNDQIAFKADLPHE